MATKYKWDKVGPNTTTQATLSDAIDEIETLFGLATHWGVSQGKTANGGGGETLEIANVSSGFTNGRCLFFGGASPHSNALAGSVTANSTYLYALGGPALGTTGPDNDFTTGHPYNGNSLGGIPLGSGGFSGRDRLQLWETEEFFCLFWFTAAGASLQTLLFGNIFVRLTDAVVWGASSSGISVWTTTWDSSNSATGPYQRDGSAVGGNDEATVFLDGATTKTASAAFETHVPGAFIGEAGGNILTVPIPFHNLTDDEYLGILRQVGYGPKKALNTDVLDSDTNTRGHILSPTTSAANTPLVLTEPATV